MSSNWFQTKNYLIIQVWISLSQLDLASTHIPHWPIFSAHTVYTKSQFKNTQLMWFFFIYSTVLTLLKRDKFLCLNNNKNGGMKQFILMHCVVYMANKFRWLWIRSQESTWIINSWCLNIDILLPTSTVQPSMLKVFFIV